MKMPEFKKAKSFGGGVFEVKCLVAKMRNSEVPEVGRMHRKEFKEDPFFEVVLVGREAHTMTDWHNEMLNRLFAKDELLKGVEMGLKQMKNSRGFEFEDEALEYMKDGSFLPWVYFLTVIIDSTRKIVTLNLENEIDSNLQEHGIIILLRNNKWAWLDDPAFQGEYFSSIGEDPAKYAR